VATRRTGSERRWVGMGPWAPLRPSGFCW